MRRHIDAVGRKEAALLEGLARVYLDETGIPIERVYLVRKTTPSGFSWHFEERDWHYEETDAEETT